MGNRPLMQAMASQQKTLTRLAKENEVLKLQLAYVAKLAGVSAELEAIRRHADIDNPAQPVPNPSSQPATESTEQAATPEAYDNPNQIGQTPGANEGVSAEMTATPMDPGTSLPTAPYNNLTDVSAPVSGTETHVPDQMTRIETDVRVGDPMNPETAYPLNPAFGPSQQQGTTPPRSGEMSQTGSRKQAARQEPSQARTMKALRLARLQIAAGLARGDDLELAGKLSAESSLTDEAMQVQIDTLGKVAKVAARQRPQGLVPRAAAGNVRRTTPSLVTQPAPITSVAGAVGAEDEDAADLFM